MADRRVGQVGRCRLADRRVGQVGRCRLADCRVRLDARYLRADRRADQGGQHHRVADQVVRVVRQGVGFLRHPGPADSVARTLRSATAGAGSRRLIDCEISCAGPLAWRSTARTVAQESRRRRPLGRLLFRRRCCRPCCHRPSAAPRTSAGVHRRLHSHRQHRAGRESCQVGQRTVDHRSRARAAGPCAATSDLSATRPPADPGASASRAVLRHQRSVHRQAARQYQAAVCRAADLADSRRRPVDFRSRAGRSAVGKLPIVRTTRAARSPAATGIASTGSTPPTVATSTAYDRPTAAIHRRRRAAAATKSATTTAAAHHHRHRHSAAAAATATASAAAPPPRPPRASYRRPST